VNHSKPCPLVGLVHNLTHLRHLANSQVLSTVPIPNESCVVWSLSETRDRPFKIKEVLGPVTYRLTLPKQWKIHDVFHACLLMPYKETELHGPNETRPPPDLVEGQEEYEIEAIISHHLHKNRETTYLIKWKGYNSSENSWILESELTNAEEELNAYKERRNLQ
jgi:hypothetical protein